MRFTLTRSLRGRAARALRLGLVTTAFLGTTIACDAAAPHGEPSRGERFSDEAVVSLLDYFAAGEVRAREWIESAAPRVSSWSDAVARARDATVRIRIVYDRGEHGERVDHGSGVLVGDGTRLQDRYTRQGRH